MRSSRILLALFLIYGLHSLPAYGQSAQADVCSRPNVGAEISEPYDLRSQNGELNLELSFHKSSDSTDGTRYCFLDQHGHQSPNLRVHPGDLLIIHLKNDILPSQENSAAMPMPSHTGALDHCAGAAMTSLSTNLHFHGMSVPPVCHQDDVIRTAVEPGDPPFEYRVRIPANQPPGLYWYHPHIHGFSKAQVLGGASGALIVEGLENVNQAAANLPEKIIVIRDQDLLNPDAAPTKAGNSAPAIVIRDSEGDAVNTGDGTGKPAKDLSVNFVPVPFPNYTPAEIKIKPGEQQVWRVLNASAITYLNLQILVDSVPQILGVVAVDGVPITQKGELKSRVLWEDHVGMAPAGRVEFLFTGPAAGKKATLITRSVNTGPGGENDPTRPLAAIVASEAAPEPTSKLGPPSAVSAPAGMPWLGDVTPTRARKLYFSETLQDPNDPNSPTTFYLTEEGHAPKAFDMNSSVPNIVVHQGDVEDWTIENRSQELHDFHIHQVHYLMLEWNGQKTNEPFLRDTINVPYWDGKSPTYPSVKLRIDFRDPNIIGTFPYHCHLLEHEDGGMMGLVKVEPRDTH